ncbi:MAG TPA: glycosyltransferase family 39 protein [Bryobacteraceae bacterium]|jgi:hypothetical protein
MQNAVQDSAPATAAEPIRKTKPSGNQFAALLGLFLLYGTTTAVHSMRKFWYDELFTFNVTQMHGFAGVWAALKAGVDFNPPLGYMVTKGFQFLFGNLELPTRLPALFGYFIMSLCLYRFISRRSAPAFGYVAAVVPWCSGAYTLASQARAYGLVLAFAGLALVCWQEATLRDGSKRGRRAWFLAGFCLSLAGALLSHCFAMLALIPFGIAELVRQYRAKRFDTAMWVALVAPVSCIAVYFPLLGNLNGFVDNNYFFKVPWTSVPLVYNYLFVPLVWPVVISALLVALPAFSKRDYPVGVLHGEPGKVQWHEWTVAGGFAIVPALAVVLAKSVDAPFFPRYGGLGVIGLSLLFTLYLSWRETPMRAAPIITGVFLVCYVIGFGDYLYRTLVPPPSAEMASLASRERHKDPMEVKPELPLVIASALEFFEIDHYAKPELASRLYYLTDHDAAMEYTQTDLFDSGFPMLKKWFPVRGKLASYQTFLHDHQRFLVYGPYATPYDWVIKKLIDDGANVRIIGDTDGGYGDNLLFEVTPKQ